MNFSRIIHTVVGITEASEACELCMCVFDNEKLISLIFFLIKKNIKLKEYRSTKNKVQRFLLTKNVILALHERTSLLFN